MTSGADSTMVYVRWVIALVLGAGLAIGSWWSPTLLGPHVDGCVALAVIAVIVWLTDSLTSLAIVALVCVGLAGAWPAGPATAHGSAWHMGDVALLALSALVIILVIARAGSRAASVGRGTQEVGLDGASSDAHRHLQHALAAADIGAWHCAVPASGDLQMNDRFRAHVGLAGGEPLTVEGLVERLHPDDRRPFERHVLAAAHEHAPIDCVVHIGGATGPLHTVRLIGRVLGDGQGRSCRLHGVSIGQTGGSSTEQALHEQTGELARSNAELEQFAYVASHDLQEPLRMIISYLQILEVRYAPLFDEKARSYFAYIAGGAQRMRALINALLEYSRIGKQIVTLTTFDAAVPLREALANLDVQLRSSEAKVHFAGLPVVSADRVQLVQLFQNLISNAIKFRSGSPPEIRITGRDGGSAWIISVTDNGIGIDPQHADRIFQIFQRLHADDAYPGSGIGLATCKRIIERHHGWISVDSRPGEGAIFMFALPKS